MVRAVICSLIRKYCNFFVVSPKGIIEDWIFIIIGLRRLQVIGLGFRLLPDCNELGTAFVLVLCRLMRPGFYNNLDQRQLLMFRGVLPLGFRV